MVCKNRGRHRDRSQGGADSVTRGFFSRYSWRIFDASAHDKTDHADRKLVNVRRHDPTTLLSAHANSTRPRSNLIDFNLNEENFHHVFTHLVRVVRRGKALRTFFFFFFHVKINEKTPSASDKTGALMLISAAGGRCLQALAVPPPAVF